MRSQRGFSPSLLGSLLIVTSSCNIIVGTPYCNTIRGVATKFCSGGRIHGHHNPPTPKFSFSSDFGHFILKMLENVKFARKKDTEAIGNISRKNILKYHNFLGDVPR